MSVGIGGAILGGAVIGGGLGLIGGLKGASAAASAGEAQLTAAQEQVKFSREALAAQIQARKDAVALAEKYGPLSADEVKAIGKIIDTRDTALSVSLSNIQKQQTILDNMDPSVKAAGKNLYDALTRETSNATSPVLTARARQRNELISNLSSQMGPGFMTSSAGIEALTKFDETTGRLTLDAQNAAVQQYTTLSGLQFQGQNAVTGQTADAYGKALVADTDVLQANQFAENRTLTATTGSFSANQPNFLAPANSQYNVMQTAGNPFAGGMQIGQTLGQIGQSFGQAGGQIAGLNMFQNMFNRTPETTGDYGAVFNGVNAAAGGVGASVGGYGANPFAFSVGGP